MKRRVARYVASILALYFAATPAAADATRPSEAEPRTKSEANGLARRQALCAKKGKVALATRVGNSIFYRCVSADNPAYKAQ
jgi:hypothetical protein